MICHPTQEITENSQERRKTANNQKENTGKGDGVDDQNWRRFKTDYIRAYLEKATVDFFKVDLNLLGRVMQFLALTDDAANIKETFFVRRRLGHDAKTPRE